MKNIEKYKNQILNYNGINYCKNFIEPVILQKYGLKCTEAGCARCDMLKLLWANEEYEEPEETKRPELTAEELKSLPVDTLLEVWDGEECTRLRYFTEYKNGKIYCWNNGATSETAETGPKIWAHASLAYK